jgi:hypothetical protein
MKTTTTNTLNLSETCPVQPDHLIAPLEDVRCFATACGQVDPSVLHAEATDLVTIVIAYLGGNMQ